MGLETVLSRLGGLKSAGKDRWIARCPAHEDKTPSLAIRFEPDGRILLHCFAGCATDSVLGAMGIEFSELFPEPLAHVLGRVPKPFSAMDALRCLAEEAAVVAIASSDIVLGKPLNDRDLERVATAAGRIATAMEVIEA